MSDKPSFMEIMKNARQMQKGMQEAQTKLKNTNVTTTSGPVSITMNGEHLVPETDGVVLDAAVTNMEPTELATHITNAVNQAVVEIAQISQEHIKGISKEFGLDGLTGDTEDN